MRTSTREHPALTHAHSVIAALPWLVRHQQTTCVIKFGGHAMIDDELKVGFAQDVVFLRHAGLRPVVVHGGGPQISAELKRRGLATESRRASGSRRWSRWR